ncbi:MAG: hypothetical protein GF308_09885 [Candidatus Heimdallarchaeota archaeon]|nr:hypothetical protein [Candidatus Heimdallarchaeota archaeon]
MSVNSSSINRKKGNSFIDNSGNIRNEKRQRFTFSERTIIGLVILMTILGFLLRIWRIAREGRPLLHDGYDFLRYAKRLFFQEEIELTELPWTGPGFFIIVTMAENLLGFSGAPMMWAIFIFPQLIRALQIVVYFVLARRLTRSRIIGLLSMFFITFQGLLVYWDQNVSPELMVRGLVPFVILFFLRYFESKDNRFLLLAFLTTIIIIFTHHLSTLFVLVGWHVIFPYQLIYKSKQEGVNPKQIIWNSLILIFLDIIVILFWIFPLRNYPFRIIKNGINLLVTGNFSTTIIITMVFAIITLIILTLAFLIYDFRHKWVKIAIIILGVGGGAAIFIGAMFISAATPEQGLLGGLLAGTNVIAVLPLALGGITSLPPPKNTPGRIIRTWFLGAMIVMMGTVALPGMTAMLGRIAMFLIGVATFFATIFVAHIISKIKLKKNKVLATLGLILLLGTTISYGYPTAEMKGGDQDFYWNAEFATNDYLINYSNPPPQTVWMEGWPVEIDSDYRLGVIIEGYAGFECTMGYTYSSWLAQFITLNSSALIEYVTKSNPQNFNGNISYLLLSEVMFQTGFSRGRTTHGENELTIRKLPEIRDILSINPHLHRIYDTKFSQILVVS